MNGLEDTERWNLFHLLYNQSCTKLKGKVKGKSCFTGYQSRDLFPKGTKSSSIE